MEPSPLPTSSRFGDANADSADVADVSLPPLLEVPFEAFNTPEINNIACISGVQARNERRQRIIEAILQNFKNGKLQHGSLKTVANEFNISPLWVRELWKAAKSQMARGEAVNVDCRWEGNSGQKGFNLDISMLIDIPFHQRKTLRALSHCLNVSTSTAYRLVKKKIRRHSNAIKPHLCDEGKLKRVRYCLSLLSPTSLPNNPTFHHCYDYIHIDEKWFELRKPKKTFYTLPNEADPYRTIQSKTHIPKIMFLAAVGHPRFGDDGQVLWDGKIGIFPFTFQEAAKRTSKNRPGTMETKPIPKIARDVMREMLVQQLLPAIREKWPQRSKYVVIQQDNAKPHVDINDPVFVAVAQESDWDIRLQFQPPNTPDLNVLDLGFFREIDAIQNKSAHRSLGDLITAVTLAFEQLTPQVLNNVFLT
ncbi:unnamed protein product [Cuscuta campestris]|uniref:DUF7769 domain-containing protein n=1 Tax=Cuscuta campestris TaxID=132261 RepID=A0A484L5D0_9ASTE|nr:unnamed protein product [Cuscuta campestris]